MLAISAMSSTAVFVWYLVALILALLAGFGAAWRPAVNFLALAFAAFVVPSLWNAAAA